MKYLYKIVSLFIISTFVYGSATEIQKFEFDDNSDGINDNTFLYNKGELIEHSNDRNYDKKLDYKLRVSNNITSIQYDNDFDNTFEKLVVITNSGSESLVEEYRVIAGKKELIKSQKIKNYDNQYDDINKCSYENYLSNIEELDNFVDNFKFIVSSMNNNISPAQNGYQVHQSCFDNLGKKKFPKMLTNAINRGLSCLTDLARENTKKTFKGEIANLINHFKIQASGKVKPVTLLCGETKHKWSDSEIAHASTRDTKASGIDIRHPYVSLNPKIKKTFFGGISNGSSTSDLEGIMFHEMIHNFGYLHGHGVDITYGCEVCCFSDNKEAKSSACNICNGNYKDKYDEKYLRDVALMSKETRLASAEISFYQNLKEIPPTQKNIDSLFIALSVRGPGTQIAFIKQLSFRGLKVSNNVDTKDLLKELKKYTPPNDWIRDINRYYAESTLLSFIEKDDQKAITMVNKIDMKELNEVGKLRERDSQEAGRVWRGLQYLKYSLRKY